MIAYYNEFDPYAAQWLRNLIKAGHIAPGYVDERDIRDVKANELIGYTQCHFFAGLGGWSRALRIAGWPDDRPVWTGSPPCQPFSTAGKQLGVEDERHLAPVWLNLVKECRPPSIFGEQVAAAVKKDNWLDDLQDALESEGYATGAAIVPACGVGTAHIRQRLWIVAERVVQPNGTGSQQRRKRSKAARHGNTIEPTSSTSRMADTVREQNNEEQQRSPEIEGERSSIKSCGCGMDNTSEDADAIDEFWRNADWLFCRDGKWRPVESGTFPLAHGISNRVGRLRAYGNAIVPQVAAEVIKAAMELANAR